MSNTLKIQNPPEQRKSFDATCKGPRVGKSFYFVPVPEIRADTLYDRVEDGLTLRSLSTKKLETMDVKESDPEGIEIDFKGLSRKQTYRSAPVSREGSTDSLPDPRKKGSILRKSRYAEQELPKQKLEKKKTITEKLNTPKASGDLKDKKNNKISFRNEIEDVKVVENWKTYNQEPPATTTSCRCNIF